MATTHDHTHGPVSGPDAPETEGMNRTLIIQGAILGGIVILLVLASVFDVI
jgi:hypothetical protein